MNRTRVRKIRAPHVYERIRSLVLPLAEIPANSTSGQPLGPESPLSHESRQFIRHSSILSPASTTGWSSEQADVTINGHVLSLVAYAAKGRAAYSVRLALKLCTDFTSSVPLGSQSGISLFRRSLSSPSNSIITKKYYKKSINTGIHVAT